MTIGAVILSRYNSSRLPGKALLKIGNKTVLELIVERLLKVLEIGQIIIATSDQHSDDPIADFCEQIKINVFRGSLDNVAERFYKAGSAFHWDYIIRINGDNIFADTLVLANMVMIAQQDKYDFISNVKGRTFPKGMSIEIVRANYYNKMLPNILVSEVYREHVTLYLYEHEPIHHYYYLNTTIPQAAGIQMALDTHEDFDRTKKIMRRFKKDHWNYNLQEIYSIWKQIEEHESTI